jgi:hypothetical protein
MADTPTPRIVFGLLSCKQSAAAIAQFADAVAPHCVLVHHDFSQTPDFAVECDNVIVLSQYVRTGWGAWSLVEAALILMETAVALDNCDYFQLVSESCLPARPVSEFADFLRVEAPDVMIDMLALDASPPTALINYGWRYLPRVTWLVRVARRSGLWWLGAGYGHEQRCGVNLKTVASGPAKLGQRLRRLAGKTILSAFLTPVFGRFPLGRISQCWVGSQWFGISRAAALRVLALRASVPELEEHYRHCAIPDESFIHTLVANCFFPAIHPNNHVTFWDGARFGPDEIGTEHLPRIAASHKFFARKFKLDPACPARLEVLKGVPHARWPAATAEITPLTARPSAAPSDILPSDPGNNIHASCTPRINDDENASYC